MYLLNPCAHKYTNTHTNTHQSLRTLTQMNQIQMNIMEGLTCNFRQQAVAINQDRCEFTPLGRVTKTIVATPDLSRAFNS